jgi:hypothetical protein
MIKEIIPSKGKGYKIQLKPLARGQSLITMIGYVTKDQGKAHYKILAHNITAQELTNGRRDHEAMRVNYVENKRILTHRNMYLEAYRFITRCLYPVIVPFHYSILYMLQSDDYTLSTEFVQSYKKLDFSESQTYWKLIWHPTSATISDVLQLIFDRRSYHRKVIVQFNN